MSDVLCLCPLARLAASPFNQCLLRAALCVTDLDAVWSTRAGTSSLMAGSEVERASNGGTKLKLPL